MSAGDASGLAPREQALVTYAERLTRNPASVGPEEVERLRAAGLSDREILDAAQVTAYFAYVNRIALGLGVELEGDEEFLGQAPAAG